MSKSYVFYNPLAGNGRCAEEVKTLEAKIKEEIVMCDMTKSTTYEETLFSMTAEDKLILCGGDGTLNRFINLTEDIDIKADILYYPTGSGNDFAYDLGKKRGDEPFSIKEYLKDLPTVTVKNKSYRFLNGVGYGIDGYCCEEGDKIRATSDKKVDYTAIAIKGLLFKYKPTAAKVTVDGVEHKYKKAWIVPTMNGRYYGGGMMPTPDQSRESADGKVSVMVFHDTGKLKTLMIFPSLFKGEHIKHKKYIDVFCGHEITVEFDSPRALQIDGETVLDVSSYTALTKKVAEIKA